MSQPSLPPHHPSHQPPQSQGAQRPPSRGRRAKPALKLIVGGSPRGRPGDRLRVRRR
ncbi:hypothetical protein SANTM175S_05788 [Streptomyces antimycoticus]